MPKVLIVEDVDTLREVLAAVLENEGYSVVAAGNADSALEQLRTGSFDCVLSDFKLPGMDGIEFLKKLRQISDSVPFLLMTAFGSIDLAIEALKQGANDFLCKPFEPETLCAVLCDLITHRRIVERPVGVRGRRDKTFLTQNPAVEKLLYQARKVAAVDSSVLVLGESGTGKELLARFIHEHSSRKDEVFVAVNCAAMPADLLESEFFGHEAGAFTGATQSRAGVFEVASKGTIFLDEIGEMPLSLQVKLLRALQEREVKRVGGNRTIKVSPRVIAATNQDIDKALERRTIRDDLYFRIAVFQFSIPPLRERPEDIELLSKYYLEYFSNQLGRKVRLDDQAAALIARYRWPGNARELENIIERAAILSEGMITPASLGIALDFELDGCLEQATLTEVASSAAKRAEIDLIKRMLARTMGNKSKAAELLGVSYKTLLNKVRAYELN